MTLEEFLAARLSDDEAIARAVTDDDWGRGDECVRLEWEDLPDSAFRHAKRHDPAHVLRQAGAGRKILAEHKAVVRLAELTEQELGSLGRYREWVLKNLAAVYSDHPDYDEAWRP